VDALSPHATTGAAGTKHAPPAPACVASLCATPVPPRPAALDVVRSAASLCLAACVKVRIRIRASSGAGGEQQSVATPQAARG
jgi:hypothetical protein